MKSTGIVRKIDSLGRVVLPIELRRLMSLEDNASLEIFVDGDEIVLICDGEDEEEAMKAMVEAIESGLGE